MDGLKNETNDSATATYKPIPEKEMEGMWNMQPFILFHLKTGSVFLFPAEEAAYRTKTAVVKVKSNGETDGADEKMLPNEDKKAVINASEMLSPVDKQNGDAKLDIGEF